jgi:hypothetical protein
MCPACVANIAVLTASATSLGGLSAFLMRKLPTKMDGKNFTTQTKLENNEIRDEANESRNRVRN